MRARAPQHLMAAMLPRYPAPAAEGGVRGLLLVVQGTVRMDSLPLAEDAKESLMREVKRLAEQYTAAREGLPPKMFFYRFERSSLLILFSRVSSLYIWLDANANLVEAEVAGKKLVSTAHLGGARPVEPEFSAPGSSSFIATPVNPSIPARPRKKTSRPVMLPTQDLAPAEPIRPAPEPEPSSAYEAHDPDSSSSPTNSIMSWNDAKNAIESILTKVLAQAQAARLIDRALKDKGILAESTFDVRLFRQVGLELMDQIPHRSLRRSLTNEFESLVDSLS